jgi:hypothetical protein
MVAAEHGKYPARIGEGSFFDLLDPGAKNTYRHFVFAFASSRTGMTAYTFPVVNNKSIFHAGRGGVFLVNLLNIFKSGAQLGMLRLN